MATFDIFVFIGRLFAFLPVIVLPFIVLGIWAFLFYNGSPIFTQIVIQGFFLLIGIPLLVFIGVSVVLMALAFPLQSNPDAFQTFAQILLWAYIGIVFILEYIYISRLVAKIEEREHMSIWRVFIRSFDSEYRASIKERKESNYKNNRTFFDQITDLNTKKRDEERLAKERLRTVLLKGEEGNNTNSEASEQQ